MVSAEYPVPMRFVGLADVYVESGDPEDLLVKYHLTAQDIYQAAREVYHAKGEEKDCQIGLFSDGLAVYRK